MDILTEAMKANEDTQNVLKNVNNPIKVTKATEATQNVHKNMDITTEATEAPENVHKYVDISTEASNATKARAVGMGSNFKNR